MDRLTKRDGRIAVHVGGCTKRADPVFEKLAQYEDLEEAGRLVILPEGTGKTLLIDVLAHSDKCPDDCNLENSDCCSCDCTECWERALSGGDYDNR